MPLKIGLNPYGVTYTVGLQGSERAGPNPRPLGLDGFIALARDIGSTCIELDWRWLVPLSTSQLAAVREAIDGLTPVCSHWLTQQTGETLSDAIRCATALDARLVRLHLTPVLQGDRARWGPRWTEMATHARAVLLAEARRAADAGLTLAVENHQDFGSEELVAMAEEAGDNVGVVLDTGNPFSVGEDPVAFATRVAKRVRHVHLKDYRAQFTSEGYRLVRCPVGDGCVPFKDLAALLPGELTASIEIGAHEARHIRVFNRDWWTGYPPRDRDELQRMLRRLRFRSIDQEADWRTPWEIADAPDAIVDYELTELHRSVANLRAMTL